MALYSTKGIISGISEVKYGEGKNGTRWQRTTLTLDVPGYQGSVTKQIYQVFGDLVDEVTKFHVGDRVEVSWSMYAREWNGKWYNNVDLVKIKSQEETRQDAAAQETPAPQTAKIDFSGDDLDPDRHEDLPF